MKWKNKGYEFEQYAKKIVQKIENGRKYYIFGAGTLGREVCLTLQWYGCKISFIDNSLDKQGKKVEGVKIITLEDFLKIKNGMIIVAASKINTPVIVKQLEEHLLSHEVDFWLYNEFTNYIFPIISVYYYNKTYMSLAQIALTERCTLKCKKCAHGCFAVDHTTRDMTVEQVFKSADSFFTKVDFIKEFVLIGGEPLLYKELERVISYIGKKYRNQIDTYSITTNGMIMPDEKILAACKKYDVLFEVSNYTHQIPRIKDLHVRLIDILKMHGIRFVLQNGETEWMDYGFEYVNRETNEQKLIEVFDACRTPCREVRGNKLYYCVMARSASDNLGYNVGQNDYLDLDKLTGENYKKELLEFTLGYSEKGYLDMCRHCNGAEAKNYPIPAAEQMEGE